jgi:iron complex outermembrane receptor protein
LSILCFFFTVHAQIRIEGEVYDQSTGQALPGANIWLPEERLGIATDANGFFSILSKSTNDSILIEVSFVGKESINKILKIQKNQKEYHIHLYMNELGCEKCKHTDVVLIEESPLFNQNSQSSLLLNSDFFQENLQGNFSKSLEKIAGINSINVGVGIAKPVIRGFSGNRIIVNQNGIAQQGQQWGNDHGLEIDALSIDRIEILKGSNSLLYGSDALAGVINILPEKIAGHNTIKASVQSIYKSNNQHWGTSANISTNFHNWFLQARYSRQEAADFRIPASSFLYNGFVLPIYNNSLKNSATREENMSLSIGTAQKWGVIRWTSSHFGFKSGIFSGAMGIPRAYDLEPDDDNRDIDIPSQTVSHFKTILNADFNLPNNSEIKFDLGYQRNMRREYSFAHAHSRQTDIPSDLALQLLLHTISSNLRHKQAFGNNYTLKTGINFQYQKNIRAGFDYLLPDFKTIRTGIYTLLEYRPNGRFKAEGGFRIDYANNQTSFYELAVSTNNGSNLFSLISPETNPQFLNTAASLGLRYEIQPNQISIYSNLGKSFRVPYPVEMVSNGVHHGTFRHEQGNPNLKTENGYQLDLGIDFYFKKLEINFSSFAAYFKDYIYLSPTARFSPLPDAGQLFQYLQTDAIYSGAELSWKYKILRFVELRQAAEIVWNSNLKSGLGLPFTPPASILNEIRFSLPKPWKIIEKSFIEIGYRYSFAQNRVDRNERSTPDYHLLNLGFATTLNIKKQKVEIGLQVQNLLNTAYLQHLSRYRLLNLPEQGRNIVCSIKVPLELFFP